jgi:cytochrome P450
MAPSWWTIPSGCSKPGQEDHGQEIDRHYQDAIAQLDETIYAMIDHRRETKGDDLLSLLMQVQDAEDGSRMSDRQLRDEVATLLLAGHETTANTLSWTWMLLAQHPQVYQKLIAELRTVLGDRTPTMTDLPQLTYANQIIGHPSDTDGRLSSNY